MSGFNKTEAYYSSLKVHNQGKNILNMDPEGHFTLKSDSIINHSFKNIKNFSQNTTAVSYTHLTLPTTPYV